MPAWAGAVSGLESSQALHTNSQLLRSANGEKNVLT